MADARHYPHLTSALGCASTTARRASRRCQPTTNPHPNPNPDPNPNEVLKLDEDNVKAIYRRAVALEAKGEYDQAKLGLKRAAELAPEDSAVPVTLRVRVRARARARARVSVRVRVRVTVRVRIRVGLGLGLGLALG